MSELKTVRLYGKLGAKFGRVHQLAISSPREAIKALCVLYSGFERYLADAHLRGVEFAVFKGKQNIGEDELHLDTTQDIRIAPIIKGSKNGGLFQTVLGVAMIGAAMILVPVGWAAFGAGGFMGGALAIRRCINGTRRYSANVVTAAARGFRSSGHR